MLDKVCTKIRSLIEDLSQSDLTCVSMQTVLQG